MYPKADPTPLTSSAPPTLYSAAVVSSFYRYTVLSTQSFVFQVGILNMLCYDSWFLIVLLSLFSAPLAEEIDPELALYLNRNYWEKKQEEKPITVMGILGVSVLCGPLGSDSGIRVYGCHLPLFGNLGMRPEWRRMRSWSNFLFCDNCACTETLENCQSASLIPKITEVAEDGARELQCLKMHRWQQYQNGESEENHQQFLKALQNAVTTFLNRMKSNHMRRRSITNDSAVLSLFQSINKMHPQLLEMLNQLDERRCTSLQCGVIEAMYYEGLQDKLAQIRDARGALNALRDEHRENLRRVAEEAERQRQIQLAQKLEIMRQKKQEYLEMQSQLAIQRLQEQEKERQLRLEQQKQTIQMRAQMPAFSLPYAQLQSLPATGGIMYPPSGPPAYQGTFSPSGSVESSPMHGVYMNQSGQPTTAPYPAMQVQVTDPNKVNAYMYPAGSAPTAQQGQAVSTTNPAYTPYQPTTTQAYQVIRWG
ncbi:hypothetical protein XELAEV_18002050mg [Xenopus laevis]|nr:hypothetical protein XELAEV_18002050mg [Xenopus laevis]